MIALGKSEGWEKPEPLDPAQPGVDIQKGRCRPPACAKQRAAGRPVSLIGVIPSFHITGALCDHGVEGFDAVGGAKGLLELRHQSQAMEGEGFFEPFLQAVEGRCIHQGQGGFEGRQRGFGFFVRVHVVGTLKRFLDLTLLCLGQIGDHVLPFVPLTALNGDITGKGFCEGTIQALRAVDEAKQPLMILQPAMDERIHKLSAHALIFAGGLDKAQWDLVALDRHAKGDDHFLIGKGLAIHKQRHEVIAGQRLFLKLLQFCP